jgi:hypothetical protein
LSGKDTDVEVLSLSEEYHCACLVAWILGTVFHVDLEFEQRIDLCPTNERKANLTNEIWVS